MHRISLILLMVLLLQACASGGKRAVKEPIIPVDTNPVPVLSPEQELLFNGAVEEMNSGALQSARSKFERLVDEQPRLAGAYVNLAIIAAESGQADAADALLTKALAANPRNVDALILVADQAQQNGRFEDAEQALLQVTAIDPSNPLAQYNLGILYELYLQEFERARQHYERYVALAQSEDVAIVKRWIKLLERK